MKIEIEMEPLPQPRPRFSNGRAYQPEKIKSYKTAIGYAAKQAMAGNLPIDSPVSVKLKFWRRYCIYSRRFGDLDNLAKAVMDACNGIIWTDDAQIISLTAEKYQGTPKIELEITTPI